ncbi:hypothetical protein JCM19241_3087 [Vibrio ishigakensis]|uniref:EcoEI R protein C-terminal domain-containing protein n=1 Tax=Vibrio ishigakensis TaxID=1481914 RepID=A0A0B8Q9L3_9VIBR|nr:hypothetical protein JCM19241_3087 [Vibrio ishigakensis]
MGLDAALVNERFTEFMQNNQLSHQQIQFLNQLKRFICQNGRIKIASLYEGQFERTTNGEGLDIFTEEKADELEQLMQPFLMPH